MRYLKSMIAALGVAMLLMLMGAAPLKAGQGLTTQTTRPAGAASALPKVRGIVKDPSGAVMPGVAVSVLQGANVVQATKTESDGSFLLTVPAGAYRLAVTAPDFDLEARDIRVTANMPSLVVNMSVVKYISI